MNQAQARKQIVCNESPICIPHSSESIHARKDPLQQDGAVLSSSHSRGDHHPATYFAAAASCSSESSLHLASSGVAESKVSEQS